MNRKARKTNINVALKIAIVESREKAQVIARRAKLTPDRLSKIVNGHFPPNDDEKAALAKALQRHAHELFPDQVSA